LSGVGAHATPTRRHTALNHELTRRSLRGHLHMLALTKNDDSASSSCLTTLQ
jgi:hypothetical protein